MPGSKEDTAGAVDTAATVLEWAMSTIVDKRARHDAWAHFSRMCAREADKLLIAMKHEARLDWRQKPRTPSGTFAGVGEALKQAEVPADNTVTKRVNMDEILSKIVDEEESKP